MTPYESFIHKSRYARYLYDKHRRETWGETVDRYFEFMQGVAPDVGIPASLRTAVLVRDVVPSMRSFMTAGPALARDNMAGYNCSYLTADHVRAFDENLYVLLCGTGVGFSVERQYINKLPEVANEFHDTDSVIKVRDSKIGWASALRELVSLLYSGAVPQIDYSRIRPAGSRLKVFGGRASGSCLLYTSDAADE